MKAKHIAFLSLCVLAGTFASCTDSHEIKITGSVNRHVSLPKCVAAMFYFSAFPSEKALPAFSPITR